MRTPELRRIFLNKCRAEQSQKDHNRYIFRVRGRIYARTMVSHGQHEIGKALVGTIARQIGLSSRELRELVACTFSEDDLYARLEEAGPIPLRF